MEENPARVPEEPTIAENRDVPPSSDPSISTADRGHYSERLDAVAGSEFVDDRIRLSE